MEVLIDCVPCMLRQALEAARMATGNVEKQEEIVEEALKILLKYKTYRNSPDLAREIHQIIKMKTGVLDPYYQTKKNDLQAAKGLYCYLKEFLNNNENSIYWALKIAATGNNIDAAIYNNIDLKKCIENEIKKEFSVCDLNVLDLKLQTASNILIIGDNTGETIFDKVFLEKLSQEKLSDTSIIYAVRSEPIINDVTEKGAYESGLGEVSRIISTGCNAPGAILEDCSDEFIKIYNEADIVISKGQGNFEALSEENGNLFFLLKAKCPMISQKLGVNLNEYVFKYNDEN